MKIITANVNGIRAATRKGFLNWLLKEQADVICLQELKADEVTLRTPALQLEGYEFFHVYAQKKGYSGVGMYTRHKPDQVIDNFEWDISRHEGRLIQADFGDLSVVSVYFPSGTSGDERQAIKYEFLEAFQKHLEALKREYPTRHYIICADWNIVHTPRDIKYFQANQKNSGCLPEERAWLDNMINQLNWIDAFRTVNQEPGQYTWWSQRSATARINNAGWRIDYQLVTPNLKERVKSASIYKDEVFSDHAPVVIEYDLDIP
jgi:exodeoxyribonuclease-3